MNEHTLLVAILWLTAGTTFALGWVCGAMVWKGRAEMWMERAIANDGELEPLRAPPLDFPSSPDFPRPLGAPHVTPPVGSQWQCRCGQCVTKRLAAATPRRPLYGFHDGPTFWLDVDALPVLDPESAS